MPSLNDTRMNFNSKLKINFDGGNLTSDAGLLLIKEFDHRIGFSSTIKKNLKTASDSSLRYHTDFAILLQKVYQNLCGYFTDDSSDELSFEPAFQTVLDKRRLASQPTISRFWNRMDEDNLEQFEKIHAKLRHVIYSIKKPQAILFDVDSTNFETYGEQEKNRV